MKGLEPRRRATSALGSFAIIAIGSLGNGACSKDEPGAPLLSGATSGAPHVAGQPTLGLGGSASGGGMAGSAGVSAGTAGQVQGGMAGSPSIGGAAGCTETDAEVLPPTRTAPRTLGETGLFSQGTPLGVAANVRHYIPGYPLWSDGADKDRYIYIPKCSTIDTSDMDHWKFPVGTRLWKSFRAAAAGGSGEPQRIETRWLHRYGPAQSDWLFAVYQWDESTPDDPTAALAVSEGVKNANGTEHDIPSEAECQNCHGKLRERVLGFGAFQLSHAATGDDLTIETISKMGWLTVPAPDGFEVPGTPVQQAALGYLHGNCGGCHNSSAQLPPSSALLLRLLVGQTSYASTDIVISTVGVATFGEPAVSGAFRIAPADPANSSVLTRMQARGSDLQMPPLETTSSELPDTAGGVAAVAAWVASLE